VAEPRTSRRHNGYMAEMAKERAPWRTADPWNDTDVIDERSPRFVQAVTGTVALIGVIFGWPLVWALMSAQLLIGLTLGRRFCLPCVAYFTLVQPRFGEGKLEDARPPRLANMMGTAFLGLAAAAWWLGAPTAGVVLGSLVAFLALLAASTGLCVGCEIYRIGARLRGISPRHRGRIDPADLNGLRGGRAYVEFTHPLCSECHDWEERLSSEPEPVLTLDVSSRPELARKYGIAVVPTVLKVAPDGAVLERLAP
jgi:Domain of unknown function (DUF4395)